SGSLRGTQRDTADAYRPGASAPDPRLHRPDRVAAGRPDVPGAARQRAWLVAVGRARWPGLLVHPGADRADGTGPGRAAPGRPAAVALRRRAGHCVPGPGGLGRLECDRRAGAAQRTSAGSVRHGPGAWPVRGPSLAAVPACARELAGALPGTVRTRLAER